MITAKRHSSSPLRVVGGCLAVYALLATGYQYFLEPVTAGNAAVSKAIPQRVVEAMAPAAAPSTVVPPPPAVGLPRSDEAPRRRYAVSGGESPSAEATSREPASPVASEFTAPAPEPTETPAAEKPKRPTKQAVRSHGQPRNPLELALRHSARFVSRSDQYANDRDGSFSTLSLPRLHLGVCPQLPLKADVNTANAAPVAKCQ